MRKYLRGAYTARVLQGLGVDAVGYWLLIDLFGTLSERRELFSQLGRDSMTLQKASWAYYIMSGLLSIAMVVAGMQLATYATFFLSFSVFLLTAVLLSETSSSLVNPVEALVLSHQPINGATYTAAKLTHLLRMLLHLVPGLSLIPALAGLFLKGCPWYFPPLFVAAEFVVGLLVALSCCAVFGWLIRLLPPARLKSAGMFAEALPWVGFTFFQFGRNWVKHIHVPSWTPQAAAVLAGVGVILAVFGLRSLSGDYLVRVVAIAHGRAGQGRRSRRGWFGGLAAQLGGGPAARAGYEYVSRMMRRDWHFRRQLLAFAPTTVMMLAGGVMDVRKSPFSPGFTTMHIFPHAFGVAFFVICSVIAYGNDHRAAWLFLLAPAGAFRGVARGVYAALLLAIAAPHAVLLPVLIRYWGLTDGLLFSAYSVAVAATYLAVELRLIEGMPFSRQPETTQNFMVLPLIMAGGFVMAVVVGLQYFVIFHSRAAVLGVSAALFGAAFYLTHRSLETLETSIRFHLGILSAETKRIYQEVEA
jgi:hypothetical protein